MADLLVIVLILALGLCRLARRHQGAGVVNECVAVGAIVGSVIAAWFRRSKRWILQIVGGSWVGYVSGHLLLDFMGWPATQDYLLLAGTVTGCLGYSILEFIVALNVRRVAAKRLGLEPEPTNDSQV